MGIDVQALIAFREELVKTAASWGSWRIPQSRAGKRPMRVSTLLRKEKDGSLFKQGEFSLFQEDASRVIRNKPSKRLGDVPSRDDVEPVRREDSRDNATVIQGVGNIVTPNRTS